MSKKEQSVLILAVTILILFMLNYFVSIPMIDSYNENMEEVVLLDAEVEKLERNIQQGEELSAAIIEIDDKIEQLGLEQYYYENYSVHNFFVDTAQNFGIEVNSLSLSDANVASEEISGDAIGVISQHPLITEQMTVDEIAQIPAYYEIVVQSTSLNVTGTIDDILDYVDHLAKDEIYVLIPSLTLSNFIDNTDDVTMTLQFIQYYYQVAENTLGEDVMLY